MIEIKIPIGSSIEEAARWGVVLAVAADRAVVFDFNGCGINVTPETSTQDVRERYRRWIERGTKKHA